MSATKMTYLICYDDHRTFTEDVRKRFSDSTRYSVESFQSQQEFIDYCRKETENKSCKLAIIGVSEAPEQFIMIEKLAGEVKKADPKTGLILLVPANKMEELKKVVRSNIDAYVPKNTNAILRIHNTVKKYISEHNITIYRKRRNFSLYVLLAFLILSALLILIAYFRLPGYF
jgi:hypothetical protein